MRPSPRKVLLALTLLFPIVSTVHAQVAPAPRTGRVVGHVLDEKTGAPISGAQVGIAAGGAPVASAIDGRYTLLGVPEGTIAIAVRAIGYSPKTVSGIVVRAGGVASQDLTLTPQTVQLEEINVTAEAEHGTVAAGLAEQHDAPGIINAVTAEQISRSPDSDAGQAVQRVSGVTVQDGRFVFVRGLGERYTTTSINDARIPSPEPERKVVPLDLFPSNLLESVATAKTFMPDQPGDFSGAQVDLRTREFDRGRVSTWSLTAGWNGASTGRALPLAPRSSSEWLGFAGSGRNLPAAVAAQGNLASTPPSQIPVLVGSFRNVWSAQLRRGAPQASTSFTLGGEDPLFRQLIGYVLSASYGHSTEVRANEERAVAVADGTGQGTRARDAYRGSTATVSVLWGGIANFTARLGAGTKLTFNNTYTRSGDNSAVRAAGLNEEFAQTFDITRLTYVSRSVRSSQLAGEHLLGGRHTIAWAATASGVTREEPDRSDLIYEAAIDSVTGRVTPVSWFGGERSANRTFSSLEESGWQLDGSWQMRLGGGGGAVKVGGQYRTTDRDADTRSYDILNLSLTDQELRLPPEQLFQKTDQLALVANAFGGRYRAADRLTAGYAQLDLPVGGRVRLVGGARIENSRVAVTTTLPDGSVTTARPTNTDVLPSLALTVDLGRSHQVRVSATQTLSRPEYRELTGVPYFDILGGLTVYGNAGLRRALIQNFDARWEWYPGDDGVVSIGAFAKHFRDPIERVLVATTGATTVGFVNADGANDYGIEFEIRGGLSSVLGPAFSPFTVSANATLIKSRIEIGNDTISSLSNNLRPMVGQAPYVVNLALAYTSPRGRTSATLFYNVVGRRITEAGNLPRPDAYEEARNLLDASVRLTVSRRLGLKLEAKNILDAPYRVTQGSVTRQRYTTGRLFAAGLTWEQ
jgi:hypothetical protein